MFSWLISGIGKPDMHPSLQVDAGKRNTIDLIDHDGSLTSREIERIQKRIDDDWVLTHEERAKMEAKLQKDKETKEAKKE